MERKQWARFVFFADTFFFVCELVIREEDSE